MTAPAFGRILIIDLRSQLTPNIERVNRDLGYRSVIRSPAKAVEWLQAGHRTDAIILSGGNFSVYEEGALRIPTEVLKARRTDGSKTPICGICYGHQDIAWQLGGSVATVDPEFGPTVIGRTVGPSILFGELPEIEMVWMNHGDSVTRLPPGFRVTARSHNNGSIAAMENAEESIFSVQFHPEATQTEFGPQILENFLKFAGCEKDWSPSSMIDAIRGVIDNDAGGRILVTGLSGGVDSTVCAAVAAPVLGDRLHAFTIDANHLRLNELDEIALHTTAAGVTNYRVVDLRHATALFAGITDAETKRKQVFQNGIYVPGTKGVIQSVGADYFMQGSLAPDFIETGETGGETIKTHHNIGIDVGIPQLHPLKTLFKYEVRALARALGLPESVSERKPSPGPGLFLGIIGIPVCDPLLDCLRTSTFHVERILRSDQKFWRDEVSQPVVAYFGTPTTGQKGDKRVYSGSIVVRAVKTMDYMTVEGLEIPSALRREIKSIVTKHPLVVRCLFDETDKPPATTVFE